MILTEYMHDLSVIMATYNENPEFLRNCVDSILYQTFRNFEFIIVVEPEEKNLSFIGAIADNDDRVKVFRNETKLGVAASRNRAIRESSGEYIAIIDSDDYCDRHRFEKQVKFLNDNPDISVVGSDLYLVDEKNNVIGERIYPELHQNIRKAFLFSMAIANPSVMLRKDALDAVGLFNDALFKAEDFDLWLRFLAGRKKMHNLQDKLVYYRTQRNSNSRRGEVHYRNYYAALKKHGRFIWPFKQRAFSLFLFFLVARIPNFFLDYLINLEIVNRIKNIKVNNSQL